MNVSVLCDEAAKIRDPVSHQVWYNKDHFLLKGPEFQRPSVPGISLNFALLHRHLWPLPICEQFLKRTFNNIELINPSPGTRGLEAFEDIFETEVMFHGAGAVREH
jgi:hypothetical protein